MLQSRTMHDAPYFNQPQLYRAHRSVLLHRPRRAVRRANQMHKPERCTKQNDGALALQSEKQQSAAAQTRCPSPDTSSGVTASFQHPGPAPVADHKKRLKTRISALVASEKLTQSDSTVNSGMMPPFVGTPFSG